MTSEFQFRALEVHLIEERSGGDRTITAVTPPVCDFCTDVRVRWDYDCEDFVIEDVTVLGDGAWGSQGGFAACDTCSEFIEHENWHGLTVRIIRSWILKGAAKGTSPEELGDANLLVNGFRSHYVPGRKAFG